MSWGRAGNVYTESYMGDFSEPAKFSLVLANYVCIQDLLKYIEMKFSFQAFQCLTLARKHKPEADTHCRG